MPFAAIVFALAAISQPPSTTPPEPPLDWKSLEAPFLTNHVQLTFANKFVRAGESYFSPDGEWIVFQAVAVPEEGKDADPFYAMYVARLKREGGRVTGLETPTRISPPGSANTCGWFHPSDPNTVLFGSTVIPPAEEQKSGFQRKDRKYKWAFPEEMEVVQVHPFIMGGAIATPDGKPGKSFRGGTLPQIGSPSVLFSRPHYDAECSFDSTGRFVLYSHVEDPKPDNTLADANLYIYDTRTKAHTALVTAPGYDGGPFFAPGDGWITYRSDRSGNDLLQIFIADLRHEKDADGVNVPVGIEGEYQLTNNDHVNWCPYWHPSGEFILYATSEVSHSNYEVFAIETPVWSIKKGEVKPADLRRIRITQASGADVLPAFSPDGKLLLVTSQRMPIGAPEPKGPSQLWIAEWAGGSPFKPAPKGNSR
ncbi:hypothetical protein PHYC_01504 [Phycisphaerales bacterium]|nr:hypothetical protein PHYC_01504 [Phycisphaerales bacterium]